MTRIEEETAEVLGEDPLPAEMTTTTEIQAATMTVARGVAVTTDNALSLQRPALKPTSRKHNRYDGVLHSI